MPVSSRDELEQEQADELASWRYQQARELGLCRRDAAGFALTGVPVAELLKLIVAGCPPPTALRILRPL